MSQCRIHHISGSGFFADAGAALVKNSVFSDNDQTGLVLVNTAQLTAIHSSIARNAIGLFLDNSSTASLSNTILADNSTGVQVVAPTCIATLQNTLWDNNATPLIGTVDESGHFGGLALFEVDGYHIGKSSTAVNWALITDVTIDIDGESRPQPGMAPPDLGADEIENLLQVFLPVVRR